MKVLLKFCKQKKKLMQVLNPLLQGWDYPVVLIADTDKFSHSRLPFPY